MKIGKIEIPKNRMLPMGMFILLILFFWHSCHHNKQPINFAKIGKPIPKFTVPKLDNTGQFSSSDMQGSISILNVFGSWCATCHLEHAFLDVLAKKGLHVYGLDYKDTQAEATAWLQKWGNPYTMVGYDEAGNVALELGVYGAPETFLLDENGVIIFSYIGVLDEVIWNKNFLPLIKSINKVKEAASRAVPQQQKTGQ